METEEFCDSVILEFLSDNSYNDEIDSLLAAASDTYEHSSSSTLPPPEPTQTQRNSAPTSPSHVNSTASPATSSSCFGKPKTDEEIQLHRQKALPAKTVTDTKYCIGQFEAWRKHRMETALVSIPTITGMTKEEMQYWLIRFVLEVRKKSGDVYPPNTLHHIVVGIMRHVRWPGQPDIDFFTETRSLLTSVDH